MSLASIVFVLAFTVTVGIAWIIIRAGAVDSAKANAALESVVHAITTGIANGVRWALNLFARKP